MLNHALEYANRGWLVIPLQPRDKVPFPGSRGLLDGTTDSAVIRQWWIDHPDANVGIITGGSFGVVLDVDDPSLIAGLDLPPTRSIVTARGEHFIFASVPIGNRRGDLPRGIDVRGAGTGYVVAPPSIHPSGHVYRWGDCDTAADMPQHILSMVTGRLANTTPCPDVGDVATVGDVSAIIDPLLQVTERRGTAVFAAACRFGLLLASGDIGTNQAIKLLLNAAAAIGLCDTDGITKVEREIRRGLSVGYNEEIDRQAFVAKVEARQIDRSVMAIGSDVEMALRLLKYAERDQPPFIYDHDALFRYDGAKWKVLDDHNLARNIMALDGIEYVQARTEKGISLGVVRLNEGRIRSIRNCMYSMRAKVGWFDEITPQVGFANGYLLNWELVHHQPESRLRYCLPFDYDSKAECPVIMQVLHDAFEGDHATIGVFLEFIGLCLIGQAPLIEKAAICIGRGGDGKSTILNAIGALFPQEARCAIPPQFFGQDYKRAELAGKRINIVSEVPAKAIENPEPWRAFISGDEVSARRPYGHEFTFRPIAGHLYSANALPGSADFSDAFWRRWIVFPFAQIPEARRDPDVKRQVVTVEELQGLAVTAINAAHYVEKRGWHMSISAKSSDAVREWREENDPVLAWLGSLTWPLDEYRTTARLYESYTLYARQTESAVLTQAAFSRRLKTLGLSPHRTVSSRGFIRV